jgi:ankyrin repeat protein
MSLDTDEVVSETMPPEEYLMDEDELQEFTALQACSDLSYFQGWVAVRARLASMEGQAQLLWLLLHKMPRVCSSFERGQTPRLTASIQDLHLETGLIKAVRGGHVTCVGVILEHIRAVRREEEGGEAVGGDGDGRGGQGEATSIIETVNRFGENALLIACKMNHHDIVRMLLAHGANPDALPRIVEEAKDHPECFVELAKVSSIFKTQSLEAWAFQQDAFRLLRYILRQKENDPSSLAWFYELFSSAGGDRGNRNDRDGGSGGGNEVASKRMLYCLFTHACRVGAAPAVEIMCERFVVWGKAAFHGAVCAIRGFHLDVVRMLTPHFTLPQLNMLFRHAIKADSTPIVMWFITAGAVEEERTDRQPPLCEAVTFGAKKVVDLFLQRGGPHLEPDLLRRALRRALFGNLRGKPSLDIAIALRAAGAQCSMGTAVHQLVCHILHQGNGSLELLRHVHRHEFASGVDASVVHKLLVTALRSKSSIFYIVRYLIEKMDAPLHDALDLATVRFCFTDDAVQVVALLIDHGATFVNNMLPDIIYFEPIVSTVLSKLPELMVPSTFFAESNPLGVRSEVIAHLVTRPHLLKMFGASPRIHIVDLLEDDDELEMVLLRANNEALRQTIEEPSFTLADIQHLRKNVFPSGMEGLVCLQRLTFALSRISPQRYAEQGYVDGEWKSFRQILDDLLAAFMYHDVKNHELGKRKRLWS